MRPQKQRLRLQLRLHLLRLLRRLLLRRLLLRRLHQLQLRAAAPTPPASTVLDNTQPVKPVTVAELIADELPPWA